MKKDRYKDNLRVIEEIEDILGANRGLRFNQLIQVLNEAKGFGHLFNEEPADTLARIKDKRKVYKL